MDPILTVVFVGAFALVAFAVGSLMFKAPGNGNRNSDGAPLSIAGLDPVGALTPALPTANPQWTSNISTWQRLKPLVLPVGGLAALAAAGIAGVWAYSGFSGLSLDTAIQDVTKRSFEKTMQQISSGKPANMPEMKPVEFKMPDQSEFIRRFQDQRSPGSGR